MNPNFLHVSALSYKTMQDISNKAKQQDKKAFFPLKSNIQEEDEVYRMTAFFSGLSQGNGLLSAAELINNPLFGDYLLITPVRKFVTDIYVICLICGNPRSCTRPTGPVGPQRPSMAPLAPQISVRDHKAQRRHKPEALQVRPSASRVYPSSQ